VRNRATLLLLVAWAEMGYGDGCGNVAGRPGPVWGRVAVIVGVGLRAYLVDRAWVHTRNLDANECVPVSSSLKSIQILGETERRGTRRGEERNSEREQRDSEIERGERERDHGGTTVCVHYTSWEDKERERERPGEKEMRHFLAFRQPCCSAMKGENGYQALFKAIFTVDTQRTFLGVPWCALRWPFER